MSAATASGAAEVSVWQGVRYQKSIMIPEVLEVTAAMSEQSACSSHSYVAVGSRQAIWVVTISDRAADFPVPQSGQEADLYRHSAQATRSQVSIMQCARLWRHTCKASYPAIYHGTWNNPGTGVDRRMSSRPSLAVHVAATGVQPDHPLSPMSVRRHQKGSRLESQA